MDITRSGEHKTVPGPGDYFSGQVRVMPLFAANEARRASAASVTFEPGARTVWHTHPRGQTLIILAGNGRVQRWGGPIETLGAGDVVWFPPGEKHWHGAAPDSAMTHIATQEHLDGTVVDWLEQVSDMQYATDSSHA
jgi:quercetin dioxygenase-like cupin family protein